MESSDIKKIKDLENENRRLKQMFVDLSLENRALKDVIEKRLYRNFFRFWGGRDTSGITKGSTVFNVCWNWIFAVRANSGCRCVIPRPWPNRKRWTRTGLSTLCMTPWSVAVVFARSMPLLTLTVRRCRLKSIWICQLCTWSVCSTESRLSGHATLG